MKNGVLIIASIILLIVTLSFFIWQYIFSIYEVTVSVSSSNVKVGDRVIITVLPINSFGNVVPFRKPDCEFEFVEGHNLVNSIEKNNRAEITFTAKSVGKIILYVSSPLSLEKNLVEINVNPKW